MRQLVLQSRLAAGAPVTITGQDFHYLARVRRVRAGDELSLMDEAGTRWRSTVERLGEASLTLVPVREEEESGRAQPEITVYQSLPKGRRFDDAIRMLVQGGATRIVPVIAERSLVAQSSVEKRTERWDRIAREAMQQSGSERLVTIGEPVELGRITADDESVSLFLHTEPLAQRSLHRYLGRTPNAVELVVGPEGGFSDGEVVSLGEAGFSPLWLGRRVLRSENAGFFAVAAIRVIVLERPDWQGHDHP